MEITEVRITLIEGRRDNVKAFASITLDNSFVVRSLKVIEKERGFQVKMPDRKRKNETFTDIAFPTNNATRIKIEVKVLQKYEEEIKELIKNNDPS